MRTYHTYNLNQHLVYDHGAIRRDVIRLVDLATRGKAPALLQIIRPDLAFVRNSSLERLYHYVRGDPTYLAIPFVRDAIIADLSRTMTENDHVYILMCQILTRFL
jgi:hypothetical protein